LNNEPRVFFYVDVPNQEMEKTMCFEVGLGTYTMMAAEVLGVPTQSPANPKPWDTWNMCFHRAQARDDN
jgi:hypothetical protein